MSQVEETIAGLRRDYVCEALDVVGTKVPWAIKLFQDGHDKEALAIFEQIVACVRSAASEASAIRSSLQTVSITAKAAQEFRENRDGKVAA